MVNAATGEKTLPRYDTQLLPAKMNLHPKYFVDPEGRSGTCHMSVLAPHTATNVLEDIDVKTRMHQLREESSNGCLDLTFHFKYGVDR